jgi:U3 small nucleolar ribonucleoprotein protein IMP4
MIITTSRKPSQRTRSFVNDLARSLNINVLNRGKTPLKDILNEYTKLILIGEYKGNPGKMKLYDTDNDIIISMLISAKLQREVCEEETTNTKGVLDLVFNKNTKKYKHLFCEFFKDMINQDSNFKMSFEDHISKTDKNLFYIQFYEDDKKVGPLIIVKSIKVMDIE